MVPTPEQREERYRAAPPEVQEAYAGDRIGMLLHALFTKYCLSEALYKEYANVFGDVVLGFENKTQMSHLLIERLNLPAVVASGLATELTALLPQPTEAVATQTPVQTPAPSPSVPPTPIVPTASAVPVSPQPSQATRPPAATWTHIKEEPVIAPTLPEAPAPAPIEDRPFYSRAPNYADAPRPKGADPYREIPE